MVSISVAKQPRGHSLLVQSARLRSIASASTTLLALAESGLRLAWWVGLTPSHLALAHDLVALSTLILLLAS